LEKDLRIRIKVNKETGNLETIGNEVDKLKKKWIHLSDGTKVFEDRLGRLREANGRYVASGTRLNEALSKTGKEFEQLPSVINKSSESTKSFGQSIKELAGYGAIAYTIKQGFDAIVFAAKDVTTTASDCEKYGSILETIEGNSQKAKESLKWIGDFAKQTPYELDQVTEAFVQMRAYGLKPTDGSLKSLGDAASAMKKPLMQSVEAMADAMTGENERLKEFGIRASMQGEEIAYNWTDSSGKAKHIIIKNNSEIIQSTLESIFNSKYQDAMKNQMSTFGGMVSNLKDQWTQFKKDFMDAGMFAFIKAFIKTFTESFTKSFMLTGSGFEALTNSFIDGFKSTLSALEIVYQGFQSFKILFNVISIAFKSVVGGILVGLSTLNNALNGVIEGYNFLNTSLGGKAIEFKFNDFSEAREKIKNSIAEDLSDISNAWNNGMKSTGIADSFNANLTNNYNQIKSETDKLVSSIKPDVAGAMDGQFQFGGSGSGSGTKGKKGLIEETKEISTVQYDAHIKLYEDYLEDKKRATEKFNDDFNRSQMTQTQYQLYELDKQKVDYAKHVEDKVVLEKWYENEKKEILENRSTSEKNWLDGINESFKEYIKAAGDTFSQVNHLFTNALYGMEDFLVDFVKTGKANFSDFFNSIADDFIRMQVQLNITKPLAETASKVDWGSMFSSFSGFAFENGGIMSASGSLPLKAYSNGGIANTPQLALFGEGRMNEAYVPLPDGRTIPVTMKGGNGGTNIVLNIENKTGQAIDASQISQMTKTDSDGRKTEVISIVMDSFNRNTMGLRDLIKGAR